MKLLPLWSKICLYRRSPLRDDDCGGDDHDYDHDYDDHDDDHDDDMIMTIRMMIMIVIIIMHNYCKLCIHTDITVCTYKNSYDK